MPTETKKTKRFKLIRCIAFLIVLALTVSTLSHVLTRKNSSIRFNDFFEEENNFDVLFMGTSHVINGILPMELWKDYGISSYNAGAYGAPLPTNYYLLDNLLDHTTPKLIVLDCSKLSGTYFINTTIQQAHSTWDAFPLSRNKYRAFEEFLKNDTRYSDSNDNFLTYCEFLFPFTVYHNRWRELTKEDFQSSFPHNLGGTSLYTVAVPNKVTPLPSTTTLTKEYNGVIYLKKFIEACKEKNIELLLTFLPCPASEKKQREANSARLIAEEYGVNYINFLDLSVVNYNTDCADADSHLNLSGARKVTDYLGQYIRDEYKITDHRGEAAYAHWDDMYREYTDNQLEEIKNLSTLEATLMSLANKNIFSCIYIPRKSAILKNQKILGLLRNIAGTKELPLLDAALSEGTGYFIVNDPVLGAVFESYNGKSLTANTSLGTLNLSFDKDWKPVLTIGDSDENYFAPVNSSVQHDIYLAYFYGNIAEPVDTTAFTVTKASPLSTKKIN